MKRPCLFTLFLLCLATQINAQSWQWGKTVNCVASDPHDAATLSEGIFVTSGINGNVYTAGTFIGNFSLHTGQLYTSFGTSSSSPSYKTFIAKYDSSGNLLWSFAAADSNQSFPLGITTDQNDNLYIIGMFGGDSVNFLTSVITNTDLYTMHYFFMKIDPSGNILWTKNLGATDGNVIRGGIVCDPGGNAIITLPYSMFTHIDNIPLTNNGGHDILIAKFDPAGTAIWAQSYGGNDDDFPCGMTIDGNNLFIAGYYNSSSINFGSGISITNAHPYFDNSTFVLKTDINGNAIWARSCIGNTSSNYMAMTTDNNKNVYIGGVSESNNVQFGTVALNDSGSGFVVKYDSSGNALWANTISTATGAVFMNALGADSWGNIWVSGGWNDNSHTAGGNIIFGSTTVAAPYSNSGCSTPMFLVQYGPNGNLGDYHVLSSSGLSNLIYTDNNGNIDITGSTSDNQSFGSDSIVACTYDNNSYFVAKYSIRPGAILQIPTVNNTNNTITIFPDPASTEVTILITGPVNNKAELSITDMSGRLIKSIPLIDKITTIPVSSLPAGTYLCNIVLNGQKFSRKMEIE